MKTFLFNMLYFHIHVSIDNFHMQFLNFQMQLLSTWIKCLNLDLRYFNYATRIALICVLFICKLVIYMIFLPENPLFLWEVLFSDKSNYAVFFNFKTWNDVFSFTYFPCFCKCSSISPTHITLNLVVSKSDARCWSCVWARLPALFFRIPFCQLAEDIDKSCKMSKERRNYRQLCHT